MYNEEAFRALDQIIEDASRSGVKLILAFTDNWHLQDGLFQYVAWANSTQTGDFFTDPAVIQLFKNHITNVVNRTNTLNSRQYKDEPAIFAWDLINELRDGCNTSAPNATCDPSFTASVQVNLFPASQVLLLFDAICVLVSRRPFGPDLPHACTPTNLPLCWQGKQRSISWRLGRGKIRAPQY